MMEKPKLKILEAQLINSEELLITFSDGRCALYKADLLNSIIEQAKPMTAIDLNTIEGLRKPN
jgi:hypothetical protein